jgi:hypothetical protein
MSYNKKIIGKEKLFEVLNNDISLEQLFSADSMIFMDNLTYEAYELFRVGYSKEDIQKKILK